mmetsp:Transcript_69806/g.177144  ORF Transcript_69806/g.177144 Transcript_69806/m.177144 type:complete len:283 (-) Transcript_69806:101-949(-)
MANTAVLVVSVLLLVVLLPVAKSRTVDNLDDDSAPSLRALPRQLHGGGSAHSSPDGVNCMSFDGVFPLSCPSNWECCRNRRSPHLASCCPPESQCIKEDPVPNCRYGPRFPEVEHVRGTATGQLGEASSERALAASSTLEREAVGNGTSMAAVAPEASLLSAGAAGDVVAEAEAEVAADLQEEDEEPEVRASNVSLLASNKLGSDRRGVRIVGQRAPAMCVSYNGAFRLVCPLSFHCCRSRLSIHLATCCPPEAQCCNNSVSLVPICQHWPPLKTCQAAPKR